MGGTQQRRSKTFTPHTAARGAHLGQVLRAERREVVGPPCVDAARSRGAVAGTVHSGLPVEVVAPKHVHGPRGVSRARVAEEAASVFDREFFVAIGVVGAWHATRDRPDRVPNRKPRRPSLGRAHGLERGVPCRR